MKCKFITHIFLLFTPSTFSRETCDIMKLLSVRGVLQNAEFGKKAVRRFSEKKVKKV